MFQRAFDQKKALKEGKITPVAGVDAEFDDATEQVNKIKDELDEHLKLQIKHFGTKVCSGQFMPNSTRKMGRICK